MGRLQIKRSNQLNEQGHAKPPLASNTEYGELAVNYNAADPVLFIKDSNNKIIRLVGKVIEEDNCEEDGPAGPIEYGKYETLVVTEQLTVGNSDNDNFQGVFMNAREGSIDATAITVQGKEVALAERVEEMSLAIMVLQDQVDKLWEMVNDK